MTRRCFHSSKTGWEIWPTVSPRLRTDKFPSHPPDIAPLSEINRPRPTDTSETASLSSAKALDCECLLPIRGQASFKPRTDQRRILVQCRRTGDILSLTPIRPHSFSQRQLRPDCVRTIWREVARHQPFLRGFEWRSDRVRSRLQSTRLPVPTRRPGTRRG